ncbi:hypothetical protein BpKM391_08000 [Burkholderia pseudomallei]|nr:hypothetical protein KNG_08170 [Burkholderia pseudomallei]BEH65725.1 hypothetical protein BpKM391_08000 [Burkholderia pseudomallei]
MTTLADLRTNYSRASLDAADVNPNPFVQFDVWFKEALDAQLPEPNTMTLATVDESGRPSARIVLIKGADERGFVFFTNYESRKGASSRTTRTRRCSSTGSNSSARCASRGASRRRAKRKATGISRRGRSARGSAHGRPSRAR